MVNKKHWLPHVVIVGGGFGGIRTALSLARSAADSARITLVSNNKNFEYYPGLHTIVGEGRMSVTEIPLKEIFEGTMVRVLTDSVVECNPKKRTVRLEKAGEMQADYIVLALGSQTEYFGIAGLPEMSFGMKSIAQAYRLREHIDTLFSKYAKIEGPERVIGLHFVVVGAGPAGVDLAGELAHRTKLLCEFYNVADSFVTIDLIEAASRVLPMMKNSISKKVERRLRTLGVHILLNRNLIKEGSWTVFLQDMTLGTKTLIWTAGLTTNEFYQTIPGISLAKKNRVKVDDYLQMKKYENIFVIGDAAETPYSGLAQTALHDGEYVARVIKAKILRAKPPLYTPRAVAYNIGVGPGWSVMVVGPIVITGIVASWMRHLIDYRFFFSILPLSKWWKLLWRKSP